MAKLTKEEKKALKKQKRSSFFADFKKFITRGNVVDLAVGVVVGGAFSKIVTSFTNGIVMPLIGKLMGKVSLADLKWVLTEATYKTDENGVITDVIETPEVAILYPNIQNIGCCRILSSDIIFYMYLIHLPLSYSLWFSITFTH